MGGGGGGGGGGAVGTTLVPLLKVLIVQSTVQNGSEIQRHYFFHVLHGRRGPRGHHAPQAKGHLTVKHGIPSS